VDRPGPRVERTTGTAGRGGRGRVGWFLREGGGGEAKNLRRWRRI
jgi:hypothetical protein